MLRGTGVVSVLFSEPKIPQYWWCGRTGFGGRPVSVLFSEPKIPQFRTGCSSRSTWSGFSALQRAENSSIGLSSRARRLRVGFSALQRAENSSIKASYCTTYRIFSFQCSSASRKFLNSPGRFQVGLWSIKFQCSSASRKFLNYTVD